MADVETTDAAVSNAQLDADSLEFAVNTNLPVMADSASLKGASPSLQELIEAELNVRLCQPDSLEPSASPDPSSLLSCDSIEPAPHTLAPSSVPATGPTPATTTGLTLDSLLDLDSLQDSAGMADTESGIDVLSPTKLDDLSNVDMDSLESSSDLPASSHSSPEPTITLTTRESSVAQDTPLTIAQAEDSPVPDNKRVSSQEAEDPPLNLRENDDDIASLGDLQSAPPLLRISESSLTIASETRSELSQVSQEVTRSSTPDSLTSFEGGSASQDSVAPQDSDVPQESVQDVVIPDSIVLQNSTALLNIVPPGSNASCEPDSVLVQETDESQQFATLQYTVDIQQSEKSCALPDIVTPLDRIVSQENSVGLLDSVSQQDSVSHLDTSLQQDINGGANIDAVAAGDLVPEETDLLSSLRPSEAPADPSPLLSPDDPTSPASLSSPQSQDCSFPSPSPAGVLPLSGTNSVCGGDFSNSARDDCDAVVVSSGKVETTTTAVCGSDGGGGDGVSGPVTSLENGSNVSSVAANSA